MSVLLGFMEDFAPAMSKDLGWSVWKGRKARGQEQVSKACFRWRGSKDAFALQGWRNYLL